MAEHRAAVRPLFYRAGHRASFTLAAANPAWRYAAASLLGLLGLVFVAVLLVTLGSRPGAVPGRGVHTIPTPGPNGGFRTMADSMYPAPVIPGKQGARRPKVVGAPAARVGEPGHLERIFDQAAIAPRPVAVWRTADRWRDLGGRGA
ncbi:MAG: hypothetical protein QOG34_2539 [Frankiaceae bacterium]|jgi:hypothetical protein|nr:hypothetical protein [Frankiaceae bacterium]